MKIVVREAAVGMWQISLFCLCSWGQHIFFFDLRRMIKWRSPLRSPFGTRSASKCSMCDALGSTLRVHFLVSMVRFIFCESPRGGAKSQGKKFRAKQMRYADGGGMNAQRKEVEMRTKTNKEGRDCADG
jgi:hypothetical protein